MELTNEDLLNIFCYMLEGRMIEQAIVKARGGFHTCLGEEAVIVGAFYKLRKDDVIAPHYRGSVIASYVRGVSLRSLLAEIMGKQTGYSCGRFRGDVCGPVELKIIGMFSGALGSNIAPGTGAALAAKFKQTDNVVVITFGDGTSNLGDFHEAINLASVLKLPAIFLCQNNQYAVSMPVSKAMCCVSIADRAVGYGIPGIEVDGNDVEAVHEVVQVAARRAREGAGPTLIDAKTYRVLGHFAADPALYRPAEEVEEWKKKDPIGRLQMKLIQRKVLNEAKIEEIRVAMQKKITTAMQQAEEDPFPNESSLGTDDIFAGAKEG